MYFRSIFSLNIKAVFTKAALWHAANRLFFFFSFPLDKYRINNCINAKILIFHSFKKIYLENKQPTSFVRDLDVSKRTLDDVIKKVLDLS